MRNSISLPLLVVLAAGCGKKHETGVTVPSPDKPAAAAASALTELVVHTDSVNPASEAAVGSLELASGAGADSTTYKPAKAGAFRDSGRSLAMVILVQGDERFMGNETYETSEPDTFSGGFTGVASALSEISKIVPRETRAALITYVGGAPQVHTWGPTAALRSALGEQTQYRKIGVPLRVAVTKARELLEDAQADRRVLVIIGDGTGSAEDLSEALAQAAAKLQRASVETYAVHYSSTPSDDDTGLRNLRTLTGGHTFTAKDASEIAPQVQKLVERVGSRVYASFQVPTALRAEASALELRSMGKAIAFSIEPPSSAVIKPATPRSIAVVVLVQGSSSWMGNETHVDKAHADHQIGAYQGLTPALETLARALPGARAALVVYAAGRASIKRELGESSSLAGALGTQATYTMIGTPLVAGLETALEVLAASTADRRALVVLGDGMVQRYDASAAIDHALARLKKLGVRSYSIHYAPAPSTDPSGQSTMKRIGYSGHHRALLRANFASYMESLTRELTAN